MTTAPKPRGRPKSKPAPVVPVEAPVPAFLAAIQAQAAAPEPEEVEVLNSVPDLRVTRSTFAAMLQVSLTTLQSYEAKGLIVKIDKRIDALASIRKIIGNLREVAGNRSSGSSEDGPNVKEVKMEEEIRELRIKNAKAEGELVDLESVHTLVRKTLVGTADWLESLPDAFEQTGVIAPGMTDEFIRIMDNQRETLISVNLKDIGLDDSDGTEE
jgi:hypothetical protein